jgi:predicted AAA+ superfamily ATPase
LLALDSRVSNQRNFWVRNKKDSDAEIDFVIQKDSKIIPVEVKSGHNSKLKSLHLFMEEAPHGIAIRVWAQPLSIDEITTLKGKKFKLVNLPFYYLGVVENLLEKLDLD